MNFSIFSLFLSTDLPGPIIKIFLSLRSLAGNHSPFPLLKYVAFEKIVY